MKALGRRLRGIAILCVLALASLLFAPAAQAATCSAAGSAGAAPSSWQTYCWFDLASYNDATARSASGQNFSINLSDGSTLTFNLRTTSTAATGASARAAPSWSGAAVGNSSFLNIPGRPILYMNNSGSTVGFTFRNIAITPPPGVATVTTYAFVVADAESTDNAEFLEYTTNGSRWELLDAVPPSSGSAMPTNTGVGTATFRSSGGGNRGRVGAYIVGSNSPTQVSATMNGAGLQGIMFAVRFASISLTKTIGGARIAPADQFDFRIESTSSGALFATGKTTGTGLGPFPAVVLSTASGIPITLRETMAAGSASALSQYEARLTCTNANTGSATVMPTDVVTTSYDFGPLSFGDAVACRFTNTALPHVTFRKALGAGGRIFNTDQFRLRLRDRTDDVNVAIVTTQGSGSGFTVDAVGPEQVQAGHLIRVIESASGSTDLSRYSSATVCTNANAASTTAFDEQARWAEFTPVIGDVITCTVTNTKDPTSAVLVVEKTSRVVSDPVNATSNPKAIPLAVVEYTITVRNEGDGPVDASTIAMLDPLPGAMDWQTAFGVVFTDGTTASGLDPFDAATMVGYSNQAGGDAPFSHTPSGTFDPAVTGIRVAPEGAMAASDGTNHPAFTIRYRMRVQ